jgi:hypothetical protein
MGLVSLLNAAAYDLHRAVKEMVLLCPRLRKHAYSSREPSFRECSEVAAAFAIHIHFVLEKLEHLDLCFL